MSTVTKAVIPVAGLGTRFLPATKSVPKEMLPLVDRPLLQYAIDEARDAGIEEFIFVTSAGKTAIEDYFDVAAKLEQSLIQKNQTELLERIRATRLPEGAAAFVRQGEARGLGHAVWCARALVGNEPFAVLLPDDVIAAQTPCLRQMIDAHAVTGGNMVAVMDVPREQIRAYGCLDAVSANGRLVRARGMVEKPEPDEAPSTLAVIGRYILQPSVMARLGRIKPGAIGEIQLTDAIADAAPHDQLCGFRFAGERFDCGTVSGFLEANVAFGLSDSRLGANLRRSLARRLGEIRLVA